MLETDYRQSIGGNGDPTYSSDPDEPTSTDSSTSSSSSSSSCSTATATDCTAFISYGIDQSGRTTTSFTSSQCTTVTACSVTPFTTTSVTSSVAPSSTRVIIFPVEGSSGDQQKAIQDSITQDLEDPSNLFVSSLDGNSGGTLFWKASLTSAQQEALKQNPAVRTSEASLVLLLIRRRSLVSVSRDFSGTLTMITWMQTAPAVAVIDAVLHIEASEKIVPQMLLYLTTFCGDEMMSPTTQMSSPGSNQFHNRKTMTMLMDTHNTPMIEHLDLVQQSMS